MSEIAAATWVLGTLLDVTAQAFCEAGVNLLELSSGEELPNPDLREAGQVDAVARLQDRLGAEVYCVHSEFRFAWDLASPNPQAREAAVRSHRELLPACARLGARHVVVHPGAERDPRLTEEQQLRLSRESLQALAPMAADLGLRLAVENLPPTHVGGSLEQMGALLESLDRSVFGFCCDTGHAALAGEGPAPYLRAFGDRLLGVHWQDNRGERDDHLFPGLGSIDWDDCFAALREVNYALPLTLECLIPAGWSLRAALDVARTAGAALRPPLLPAALLAAASSATPRFS
ncbi:MAG TPA: sugar phosphate isomerase/epimerase family protein [Armatimonadota bacterium]|jgi:sugar phosphate isomerase/epimerase